MPGTPVSTLGKLRMAVLAVAAWSLACGEPAPTPVEMPAPNIVLVSIDSLRASNLGCYGYDRETSPFIDSLAAEGVRFEGAVSTGSWTLPAHAALFTGLWDSTHGLVDNGLRLGEGHRTLAERLHELGYHTAGFFGGPYLHPAFGLGQGFDVYQSCMTTTPDDATDDEVRDGARAVRGASHADVTGPRTLEEVTRWAESGPRSPYFLFVHLWDVHYDYIPPREYVERFDPGYDGDLTGEGFSTNERLNRDMPERDLRHLIALYDGEIRFTDDILRRIFSELGGRGLLENTLVVVTADHGEEFFEHGGKGHQRTLFEEVVRVPLVVHWPGRVEGGRVVDEQVSLIDLMPTLLRYAGHDGNLPVQGRDISPLLEGTAGLPERPALLELLVNEQSMRALRSNEAKILQLSEGRPTSLFDLRRDPMEQHPILPGSERETERRAWERRLLETVGEAIAMGEVLEHTRVEEIEVREELLERLRGLGYVGD